MAIKYKTLYTTLQSGTNRYTFTDDLISNISKIAIWTDDDDVYPLDAEIVNTHSVSIEISDHINPVQVALVINNIEEFDPDVSGVTSLSALTDVLLTSPASGNLLFYNASLQKWVNANIDSQQVADINFGNVRDAVSTLNGNIQDVSDALDDKQDRLIAGENITIVNNVISATGGSGGSSALSELTDVSLTSPTTGNILYFNGQLNKWVNANLTFTAAQISYNNTTSGIQANNVQDALDNEYSEINEIKSSLNNKQDKLKIVRISQNFSFDNSNLARAFFDYPNNINKVLSVTPVWAGAADLVYTALNKDDGAKKIEGYIMRAAGPLTVTVNGQVDVMGY